MGLVGPREGWQPPVMTRGLSLLCFALLLSACSRPPTQLLVAVRSDLEVPQAMTAVSARVRSASGAEGAAANTERRFELVGAEALTLPFSFGVAPIQGDPAIPLVLEVEALSPAGDVLVLSRTITGFQVGKTLLLEVFLSRRCQPLRCGAEQTCSDAMCVPALVASASLPEVVPGQELSRDAGASDASAADLGTADAGDAAEADGTAADVAALDADPGAPDAADAGDEPADGAVADGSEADGSEAADGAVADATLADASDGGADAGQSPDAAVGDATTPDVGLPDSGLPDVGVPDSGLCSGLVQPQPMPTFSAQLSATQIGGPALSVTPAGRAMLVWMEHDSVNDALRVKASAFDGISWAPATTVDVQMAPLAQQLTDRRLSVALEDSGLGLASWRTPGGAIWAARFDAGAWGAATRLSTSSESSPLLALRAGRAFVAWRDRGQAKVSRYPVSVGFGPPQSLGSDVQGDTEVAINASGRALLAYYGRPAATGNGIYVHRWDGAAWSPAVRDDRSPGDSDAPSVALDDLGNAFGSWRQITGPGMSSQRARVGTASAFVGPEARIDAQTGAVVEAARLAVDGCGGALEGVVQANAGFQLWMNRYRPGVGWQTALDLVQDPSSLTPPAIAMNRHSSAVAAWNIADQVRAAWSSGGSWSASFSVAPAQAGVFVAVVAGMGDNGHPILAWTFNDPFANRSRLFVNVLE